MQAFLRCGWGDLRNGRETTMQRKRPHWEREELLQVFLLGASIVNPKLLESVQPSDFTGTWARGAEYVQKALKGKDSESLYRWLENNLGVKPTNGTKAIDAALERLRQDAVFREAQKTDGLSAQVARLVAEMRDRQLRKQ